MKAPAPEKVARLQRAIAEYESGTSGAGIFDEQLERDKAQVRHRALLLIDQRARSRHELCQRLEKLDFDPSVITEVLDDLERVNVVDDAAFAREWVRQRHARRGKSARALDRELKTKGVDEACRNQALEQVSAESERDIAWRLATKKASTVTAVPASAAERDKVLRRIVGVLARRGFNQGMSLTIARQALNERCAEITGER